MSTVLGRKPIKENVIPINLDETRCHKSFSSFNRNTCKTQSLLFCKKLEMQTQLVTLWQTPVPVVVPLHPQPSSLSRTHTQRLVVTWTSRNLMKLKL